MEIKVFAERRERVKKQPYSGAEILNIWLLVQFFFRKHAKHPLVLTCEDLLDYCKLNIFGWKQKLL